MERNSEVKKNRCPEGLDVTRGPTVSSRSQLLEAVDELANEPNMHKSIYNGSTTPSGEAGIILQRVHLHWNNEITNLRRNFSA